MGQRPGGARRLPHRLLPGPTGGRKGFIYAQGEEIVAGHSIERLCHSAARWDPAFAEQVTHWSIPDGYYVPTRYPNSLPDSIPARVYTREAAREAVRLAEEMVAFARHRLE